MGLPSLALSMIGSAAECPIRSRNAKPCETRSHLDPPAGRFVEVDGVRLHYVEQGGGPPLVLRHGLGSKTEDFRLSGLIDEAAQRYRVIAFDRPSRSSVRTGRSFWAGARSTGHSAPRRAPDAVPASFANFPAWMSVRPETLRAMAEESDVAVGEAVSLATQRTHGSSFRPPARAASD